ncbi:hypothetical protein Unana1_05787 [Umbelopsis nana]
MEPSSVSESFHTALSFITSSASDSHSSPHSSSLWSSSVASTVKPDPPQPDMSRNLPSTQSPEQTQPTPEPNNRVQVLGDAEASNDSTSQLTTDTAQPEAAPTELERDIIFCSIIESKRLTNGPMLQKENRTRKAAQRFDWKEMEVVLTSKEVLFYTMSRILPDKRYLDMRIKMSWVTQFRLASVLEYIIEFTAKTSTNGVVRITMRPRTSKLSRHWYMLLHSLVPQSSKTALPTTIDIKVPDIEMEFRVPIATCLTVTYGQLKEVIMKSMMEDTAVQEIYEKWHQHKDVRLCWRYRDRLEWCADENEKVLGPQLVEGVYDLELRKIEHMPTSVTVGGRQIQEPEAMEGILIRLTNRHGQLIKNQKFSKRRFFLSTHQQYLLNMSANSHCGREERIAAAQGMIDLCEVDVIQVWKTDTQYGSSAFQSTTSMISSTSSAPILDRTRHQGPQHEPKICWCCFPARPKPDKSLQKIEKQKRCFQLVLKNGLMIVYEALSVEDRDIWIQRLQDLSLYWKTLKHNMMVEQIRAQKDQIIKQSSPAHPKKANNGKIHGDEVESSQDIGREDTECSGPLFYTSHFRKPFKQDIFVLTRDGQLMLFNSVERNKMTGQIIPSIYHSLKSSFDLSGTYVYTDNDNQAPPRRPARIYLDGLVVPKDEEENACTFAIWVPSKRRYYSHKKHKVIVTKQHTLQGKSWLFIARSRQEKDLWVTALNAVLDRNDPHNSINT